MSFLEVAALRVLEEHARQSLGSSDDAIYRMVAQALASDCAKGELFVDVGCGRGALWPYVRNSFTRCVGIDAAHHGALHSDVAFVRADLDRGSALPLPDGCACAAAAVEVIEHLENPRALIRELVRITKPGGWVLVTTPNQRSLLSLATLVIKGRFVAFQDGDYPAHITALLDVDLRRISAECGIPGGTTHYSCRGRVALTARHYPAALARLFPRALSDNLMYLARKRD